MHTEFSVLDGKGTVKDYIERTKELGQDSLAITDHGNLCGAPSFYHAARQADIEPIIGCELYFTSDITAHKLLKGKSTKGEEMMDEEHAGLGRYHMVVLAKGEPGYKVLCELSTESHRNFYHKPLVDKKILEALGDDAKHLVVLSGCAASSLSRAVWTEDEERIRDEVWWWRETFPHFFIELQHHDTDFDKPLTEGLIEVARKYELPMVITNDPHYVREEECDLHDALLAIQTAADIDDPDRFRFDGSGHHLRSDREMARAFARYGREVWAEGRRNTRRIARACHTRIPQWERRTWHIPRYPDAEDPFTELRRLAVAGLRARGLADNKEYRHRLSYELKVIKEVGIADFLLITMWCLDRAREEGIPVGPGRGSVAGCLTAWLIGIHKIDSIRYNLRFDRFLNPARPRMPDIDSDLGKKDGARIFEIVEEKFGRENVIHVAAYQTMKLKRTFQSLAKAYGVSYPERVAISKQFSNEDDPEDVLPEAIQKAHPDLAEQMSKLAGIKNAIANHPAGVIIASPEMNIRQLVPEMWLPNPKRWVGQFDLDAAEEMGLMKEDFLRLRTLDTIAEAVALIERQTGERLDPDSWVPDEEEGDAEVYAMLAEGRTAGVFQMEGPANQRGCRDVQPVCFEDIVSTTALYRTGPIRAGYPKIFNGNRRKGKRQIKYSTPLLKPFLEQTWGVILYQEQVMDIGEHIAGFDAVQVDDIKEAIKHKKSALMESMKPVFVEGCTKTSHLDPRISSAIWKDIEGYSGYSYNRSHAVAYSMTTYQTARLKCHWPLAFIAALMRTVEDDDKRDAYLREAIEMGAKILPPCINRSDLHALPVRDKAIRFGLQDVAKVGEKMGPRLLEGRPRGGYTSVEEVADACRNQGVVKNLAAAGALRCLGIPEDKQAQGELLKWQFQDPMRRYREKYGDDVVLPSGVEDEVRLIGQIFKADRGKTKNDKPYMTWKIRWSVTEAFDVRLWSETEELWHTPVGSIVSVVGTWEPRWMNVSIGDPERVRVLKSVK